MKKFFKINKTIKPFKKVIQVEGDKSLSIRWVLLASLSQKKSIAYNLLRSEDVLSALDCIKKLGSKVKFIRNRCEIKGTGFKYKIKKNLILNAGNSGTLGRLILGLLINQNKEVKLIGDKSLSKRDFSRVINPLKKFGAKFESKKNKLPLVIKGLENPKSINYIENRGSAQVKTSVIFAALKTNGTSTIKAKPSRNHSESLLKYLKVPIKVKKINNYDLIKVKGINKIQNLNYKIPGDISSCAFFIVLTALSNNSKLKIKNVNINPTRVGILKILKIMGVNISVTNIKTYKGEKIADLIVKSKKSFKPINCPTKLNSAAIDEFLLIFLVAAKANGISYFKNLSELNQKESPRLIWGSKILNKMGIKTVLTKDSIKIFGNPNLKINRNIVIKEFLKDHRVFMASVVAALTFGGEWKIFDKNSINTSFPTFIGKIKILGAKFK